MQQRMNLPHVWALGIPVKHDIFLKFQIIATKSGMIIKTGVKQVPNLRRWKMLFLFTAC